VAEGWYRKAIEGGRAAGDMPSVSNALGNLAELLRHQPDRLAEARRLAEEALAIKEGLEPGVAEIWNTYSILAAIAERQSRAEEAADYRRRAREAKRRFAGTAHELKRHLPVILGTLQVLEEGENAEAFGETLSKLEEHGWGGLVTALRAILSGERDPETLCDPLDPEDSMIVETILQAIEEPATLDALRSP